MKKVSQDCYKLWCGREEPSKLTEYFYLNENLWLLNTCKTHGSVSKQRCLTLQGTYWSGQVSILSISMSINYRKGVASKMFDKLPLSMISILFDDLLHKGKF